MGTLYKRGNIWWIKYYRDGKPYRESAKTKKKTEAEKLLKLREGTIVQGTFRGLQVEKTTIRELLEDLVSDYLLMERKSTVRVRESVAHLGRYFGDMRACQITTSHINLYIFERQGKGAMNATINRELSALHRAYTLGVRHAPAKVAHIPYIPKLRENNVRKGFFEFDEYVRLRDVLPASLKPLVIAAYYTGMRRSELLGLQWHQVDIWSHRIVLEVGTTKNDGGRVVYMYGELFEAILTQKKTRDVSFPETVHVFFEHATGLPLNKDFRPTWEKAVEAANLPGRLFHDFRRTAVRNMIRAGVPELVAMRISGHKTRQIFDRYNITDEEDLRQACERLSLMHQEHAQILSQAQDGHNLGTFSLIRGGKQ